MSENRYNSGPDFLAAIHPDTRPGLNELRHLANSTQPIPLLQGAGQDATQEHTTAKDRALATTIRILLWVLTVFLAGGGLFLLDVDLTLLTICSAVLLVLGFRWLTRLDYEYSAPGIARYAIDAAERLAAEQMENDLALRKKALDSFIRHLES